ncbi:MAG: histidinol-phosphate transaminase [Eubacteriales bacterium]|nr:histidinol-phosphate transaminase [Eubacteriales bacterium]
MGQHKHGGDIYTNAYRIDFSANINPLGIPESVCRAAQEAVLQCAAYPDVEYRALRRALASKEAVKEAQIICGNGAAELIFAVTGALRPKKALLMIPGFAEYEQALEVQGCECVYYELKEAQGFAPGEDYLEALTKDLDMVFLCNPNNPTGMLTERGFVEKLLKRCREYQIRVVLDSCFIDFLEKPEEADFSQLLEEFPNLFILKAFTKTYAMAGLRLGYGLCADENVLQSMRQVMQPWSVSTVAQAAGEAALRETAYVERARSLVTGERQWLKEQMRACSLTVYESEANYIFFRGPKDLGEKCAAQGFLIRDCSNYRGLCAGYYRIAVRTHRENEALIQAFRSICGA